MDHLQAQNPAEMQYQQQEEEVEEEESKSQAADFMRTHHSQNQSEPRFFLSQAIYFTM